MKLRKKEGYRLKLMDPTEGGVHVRRVDTHKRLTLAPESTIIVVGSDIDREQCLVWCEREACLAVVHMDDLGTRGTLIELGIEHPVDLGSVPRVDFAPELEAALGAYRG